MKKIRVGIVGCGNIFPMHAISVKQNENLELVAVCDNKKKRLEKAALEYQATPFADYETMLKKASLDVIHICTPHYLHSSMTVLAANYKVHVLTEKPMDINVLQAKKMIEACNINKTTLGVIFQNRYNKGALFLKEALMSGRLGKIKGAKCQVTWNRSDEYYLKSDWKGTWDKEGGGAVIDQAIHTLDLMNWFIDFDIEYIDANIANRTHQKIEVEDTAEGVIKYKNGILANFHVINYYSTDSPITISLDCEKGSVEYIDGLTKITFQDGSKEVMGADPKEIIDYGNIKQYWGVSHIKQINDFYVTIKSKMRPTIDGHAALVTQKIVNAIYQSGQTNKRVFF